MLGKLCIVLIVEKKILRVIDSRIVEGGAAGASEERMPDASADSPPTSAMSRNLLSNQKKRREGGIQSTKILQGMLKACEKRPVTMEVLESLVGEIEKELRDEGYEEVPTSRIGEKVMEKLKEVKIK